MACPHRPSMGRRGFAGSASVCSWGRASAPPSSSPRTFTWSPPERTDRSHPTSTEVTVTSHATSTRHAQTQPATLRRRLPSLAIVLALVTSVLLVGSGPAEAAHEVAAARASGDDRDETAATLARLEFPEGTGAAVLATGETYPDALAGTRYGTAAAVAAEVDHREDELGRIAGLTTAFVASGEAFPDALAAGSLATTQSDAFPILLVRPDAYPSETEQALADLGIEQAIIVGGTEAVDEHVERHLEEDLTAVLRLGGDDRAATAVALATSRCGSSTTTAS